MVDLGRDAGHGAPDWHMTKWYITRVGAKMGGGADSMPLHVANQPHQSSPRPCVTERNDVFGIVCSEESDLVT